MKFVDLFCGAGLGARGAYNAGVSPAFAVDAWDLATKTYKANFRKAKVVNGRVEDPEVLSAAKGIQADILMTSPECTSHSIARGAKEGCEKSRETAISILPWIETVSPRWVVVENVTRMRQWDRHLELKAEIDSLGYLVSEVVLNAAEFGAPQKRKRLFLICDREGNPPEKEDFEKYKVSSFKSASSVIDWQGDWRTSPLFSPGRAKNTVARAERAIDAIGHGKPFIIVYYGSDYAGGWQALEDPLRTITTIDRFALVTYVNNEYRMRMLQPNELLTAMGAGKHKLPVGTRRDKIKLCGNGVCASATNAIFKEIISRSCNHLGLKNAI